MQNPREEALLDELHRAVRTAPHLPREIEVGTELSIALGRRRTVVECGGCTTPLSFEGVPVRTVVGLRSPFRLVTDAVSPERNRGAP
ncbi:MAG: hypothetical protein KGJ23_05490 [Euryarchaeota archaeon]|nr:hypothetical protein [Euryarchaeota archaeon]MDE1836051.1 hypothetical protein [Euryarchaeota archaeon]MDE1881217.1 hypothetical protein [Euryarchaeota archaeon]MDE2044029.1 hypothetical protein [Thermoplasmata archaeon]